MIDLFLTEPNEKYKRSFENYILAYKKINDENYFNKYKRALENFYEYLNYLKEHSEGKNLPQGYVATSTFWLIDREEVVGVVRVRHQEVDTAGHIGYDISPDYRNKGYGFQILKLALKKAAKIGIKDAIVTCNIENIASKKIIEKNNGKFLETIFDEEEDEHLYKYSINLTSSL
ncbi:GNAT family N-acetyltransferase [Clostridium cellulovorans]|uniref:GCN5-related N-acetyltransferase n=1 Tax=Clostridium cellulovorans (strain ATCC 35296 / DSM 3052 / OCM 3 / 743B) TaxID=573061 RepID=D9STA8_CLOC7|nr:GNAT family N-acetyltransferase [Clostridium cellulovorans]ADL50724.1 GCN5-related N-acetyltransferase [Clostridium cellulovorans 743B]